MKRKRCLSPFPSILLSIFLCSAASGGDDSDRSIASWEKEMLDKTIKSYKDKVLFDQPKQVAKSATNPETALNAFNEYVVFWKTERSNAGIKTNLSAVKEWDGYYFSELKIQSAIFMFVIKKGDTTVICGQLGGIP